MAKKPDSVTHHEERHAQMRDEAAVQQKAAAEAEEKREVIQAERERVAVEAESQELAQYVGLAIHGETRDMLLDRIRQMRTEKPKEEDDKPGFRSPQQQKEFELEQAEGRKRVAENEAELEKNREIWRKQEEEERTKKNMAMTETVHHPNPSQDQQYPTTGATLGPRK